MHDNANTYLVDLTSNTSINSAAYLRRNTPVPREGLWGLAMPSSIHTVWLGTSRTPSEDARRYQGTRTGAAFFSW